MARPIKNSCDYFPHDCGMRNHPKVKALRTKYTNGYAIWVMLLEYLTGSDGNVLDYSELNVEILSGDFGVSVTEIREVIDYCIRLEMLFNIGGFINSESLDERLLPVYTKRGKSKELSKKQLRTNGRFCNSNSEQTVETVTETPQSKGKEIKEDASKKEKTKEEEKSTKKEEVVTDQALINISPKRLEKVNIKAKQDMSQFDSLFGNE